MKDKNQPTLTNRIEWIDTGRGICMLLVIIYHSMIYFAGDSSLSFIFTPFFLTFFFFLSGYLFNYKNDFNAKLKIQSIFRGIIWPYFVFTSIIWLPKAMVHGNSTDILAFMKNIFGGYASWFVAALAVSQLLFIAVKKITDSIFIMLCIGICFITASIYLRNFLPTPSPWFFLTGFISLFYLILGYIYREKESILLKIHSRWTLTISIILYLSSVLIDQYYLQSNTNLMGERTHIENPMVFLVLSLLGILMLINISHFFPVVSTIQYIGRFSLLFYFLNGGVILLFSKLNLKFNILFYQEGESYKILIVAIACTTILYFLVKLIVRFFPWMYGDKESIRKIITLFRK